MTNHLTYPDKTWKQAQQAHNEAIPNAKLVGRVKRLLRRLIHKHFLNYLT